MLSRARRAVCFGGGRRGAGVPTNGKSAEELIEEGARKIIEGIEILIESIPVYGAPRIEENGDIRAPGATAGAMRNRRGNRRNPRKPELIQDTRG